MVNILVKYYIHLHIAQSDASSIDIFEKHSESCGANTFELYFILLTFK